jgi:hypothetical protein
MVVTDMFDPTDKEASNEMKAGKGTAAVDDWHSDTSYKMVP